MVIRKRRGSGRSDLCGELVIVLNRVVKADLIEKTSMSKDLKKVRYG